LFAGPAEFLTDIDAPNIAIIKMDAEKKPVEPQEDRDTFEEFALKVL